MSKLDKLKSQFGQDTVEPIPKEKRTLSFLPIFLLWVGAAVIVTTIYTGMMLVPDLPYTNALWIIFFGSFIGAFFLIALGSVGTRTGLPTLILTRGSFGHRGSVLPSASIMVMYIGWTFIQSYMAALSLDYAVFFLTGYTNIDLFIFIVAFLTVAIVLYGYKGVVWSEKIVAGSMILLSVALFWYMFSTFDVRPLFTMSGSDSPEITNMIGFDIVFVTVFTFMALVADYNRYAISNRVGMIATFAGYNIGNIIALLLGITVVGFAILQNSPVTYDPTVLIAQESSWMSLVAALVIFFSVLTTNVLVVYSATMSYLAIFNKHRFWVPALIIGIITIFGAFLKDFLLEQFTDWLILSGVVFIPLVSIMLADYYILKRANYDAIEIVKGEKKTYWYLGGVNYAAYLTFILGTAFAYYFSFVNVLETGATLFAFVFSVAIYLLLERLQRQLIKN